MRLDDRAKNVRFVERLRKNATTRKRDAILASLMAVVFMGASYWMESSSGGLRSHAVDVFARVDNCSPVAIHREIWLTQDIAVTRAKAHLTAMIFSSLGGFGVAIALIRILVRKDDVLVMLWDRIAALELQLGDHKPSGTNELTNRGP